MNFCLKKIIIVKCHCAFVYIYKAMLVNYAVSKLFFVKLLSLVMLCKRLVV